MLYFTEEDRKNRNKQGMLRNASELTVAQSEFRRRRDERLRQLEAEVDALRQQNERLQRQLAELSSSPGYGVAYEPPTIGKFPPLKESGFLGIRLHAEPPVDGAFCRGLGCSASYTSGLSLRPYLAIIHKHRESSDTLSSIYKDINLRVQSLVVRFLMFRKYRHMSRVPPYMASARI